MFNEKISGVKVQNPHFLPKSNKVSGAGSMVSGVSGVKYISG